MNLEITTIDHQKRIQLGLSPEEYCVLDFYYKVQIHPKYSIDGWADLSDEQVWEFIWITEDEIRRIISTLIEIGFIETNQENTKLRRVTSKWYDLQN